MKLFSFYSGSSNIEPDLFIYMYIILPNSDYTRSKGIKKNLMLTVTRNIRDSNKNLKKHKHN